MGRSILRSSLLAVALAVGVVAAPAAAGPLDGRWDASVTINGTVIPFRLDLAGDKAGFVGTVYNGDQPVTTTTASLENGKATLAFEHYLTAITASLENGKLVGTLDGRFEREKYIGTYAFEATRYTPRAAAANAPSIDGVWELPYDSTKGEKAWRFIVKQKGPEVSAAILRVDGDTGSLTGEWRGDRFVLSHFDGSRPLVAEVKPSGDGTLSVSLNGAYTATRQLTAFRPDQARAKGFGEPANFTAHSTVRDPNERFAFSFPDVNGTVVSNTDARYQGKVVIAVITGTWCPNCHDEAQYLVQLDKKYRSQGLEIVALNFEEPEQQDELSRVHAFVRKYGVRYPYLIAGAPIEMWEKVPQILNLNSWPTTVFVGRDGKVKQIHAGFAAPASGQFHEQLKAEFTSTIERLLAEKASPSTPAPVSTSAPREGAH
jgi:thiol-disulfide isomerase/thioredoxin